jgi:hypothetical protein
MKKSTAAALVLIIAAAAAGAVYFSRNTLVDSISRPAVEEEKKAWQQKTAKLESEVNSLKEEIKKTEPAIPQEKLSEAFGKAPVAAQPQKAGRCEEITAQTEKFFSYLDQKGYLKAFSIEGSARDQYQKDIALLENNRPLISGETQDLYTLMRNISFFYRLLGAKNIQLIVALMTKESALMEPTIKLFFETNNPWQECSEQHGSRLSPEALYDYAGFFLTTIAGHSYLARRDSKTRALVLYYSILIIDKANGHGLNKYGIDIRQPLDSAIDDIESQRGLLYRKDYLGTLNALKKKYQGQTIMGNQQ